MVYKIRQKGAPGVVPKSSLSYNFKKWGEVFLPFHKRSLYKNSQYIATTLPYHIFMHAKDPSLIIQIIKNHLLWLGICFFHSYFGKFYSNSNIL